MKRSTVIVSALLVALGPVTGSAADAADTGRDADGSWQELEGADDPPERVGYDVVNDRANHRLVLFGGYLNDNFFDDTWVRQDGSWSELDTTGGPSERDNYAMAYDAARGETVLWGGEWWEGTSYGDTWVLRGSTWEQQEVDDGPPASRYSAAAYDPVREKVVLFTGGSSGGGQTWTWDGETWERVDTAASAGPHRDLLYSKMAWDESRQAVILYGGLAFSGGGSTVLGETWAWDGAVWTELESGPPREQHAMGSYGRHVAVFGGNDASHRLLGETWVLRKRGWVQLEVAVHPVKRWSAVLVPTHRDRTLLLGGSERGRVPDSQWLLRR